MKIFRRISRSACTEIAFAFAFSVLLAVTSVRATKAEVKGQTGKPLDCPRVQLSAYEARERIFPRQVCKLCHAVSSAPGGARRGGRDT